MNVMPCYREIWGVSPHAGRTASKNPAITTVNIHGNEKLQPGSGTCAGKARQEEVCDLTAPMSLMYVYGTCGGHHGFSAIIWFWHDSGRDVTRASFMTPSRLVVCLYIVFSHASVTRVQLVVTRTGRGPTGTWSNGIDTTHTNSFRKSAYECFWLRINLRFFSACTFKESFLTVYCL